MCYMLLLWISKVGLIPAFWTYTSCCCSLPDSFPPPPQHCQAKSAVAKTCPGQSGTCHSVSWPGKGCEGEAHVLVSSTECWKLLSLHWRCDKEAQDPFVSEYVQMAFKTLHKLRCFLWLLNQSSNMDLGRKGNLVMVWDTETEDHALDAGFSGSC